MKFFTVYTNPLHPSEIKLVPEGFSWLAFILGPFGLFLQKSWIHGLILFGFCFSLLAWGHPSLLIIGMVHFLAGCFANSFRKRELNWKGWTLNTIVAGNNKQFALLRALDQHSNLK